MHVVILHYHLNRGGVTSVVENHLRSLATLDATNRPSGVTIVHGGRASAWNQQLAADLPFNCELRVVPELEYDNFRTSEGDLYDSLQPIISPLDRSSTVLHVHNHGLGKNAAMAPTVGSLANEGWRLLLQIHDFAEDLRPANYRHLVNNAPSPDALRTQLYPQATQIQYAVLNQRDEQILRQAGIDDQRLSLLPNPIKSWNVSSHDDHLRQQLTSDLDLPAGHRLLLYPVRPIRRKNLGEFLLWSLLADDATLALTLAPLNPQEQASYQRWTQFAADLQLPVRFETADRTYLAFEQVYAAADNIITTSVAEGFGMVYLEASLAGKPLLGRSLPGVCDDFVAAGMQFPGLAETMAIPADAIDLAAAMESHLARLTELRRDYNLPAADESDEAAIATTFGDDLVDFARLESTQQRTLLQRLHGDASLREQLRQLNPIVAPPDGQQHATALQTNQRVIDEHYSPAVIGQRLDSIYRDLLTRLPESVEYDPCVADGVLDRFVHPNQLFPIRLEP